MNVAHLGEGSGSKEGQGALTDRILLVEDDPDIQDALYYILEDLGAPVTIAENGRRGVELALEMQPYLSLIDIGLPVIDGYEAARMIRADPEGKNLFLVALTGYSMADDRRRALEAGFDAHMVKPLRVEELSELIEQARARALAARGGA